MNWWVLGTFSFWSIFLSFLSVVVYPLPYNNGIYSSLVCALIGYVILLFRHPVELYDLYGENIKNLFALVSAESLLNLQTFIVATFIIHAVPVYLFKPAGDLGDPFPFFCIWTVLFFPYIEVIYPLSVVEFFATSLVIYILYRIITRKSIIYIIK